MKAIIKNKFLSPQKNKSGNTEDFEERGRSTDRDLCAYESYPTGN